MSDLKSLTTKWIPQYPAPKKNYIALVENDLLPGEDIEVLAKFYELADSREIAMPIEQRHQWNLNYARTLLRAAE